MSGPTYLIAQSPKLQRLVDKTSTFSALQPEDKKKFLKLLTPVVSAKALNTVLEEVPHLQNLIEKHGILPKEKLDDILKKEKECSMVLSQLKNENTPDSPNWVPHPITFDEAAGPCSQALLQRTLKNFINEKGLGIIGNSQLTGKRNFGDNFIKNARSILPKAQPNIIVRVLPDGTTRLTFPSVEAKEAFVEQLKEEMRLAAGNDADRDTRSAYSTSESLPKANLLSGPQTNLSDSEDTTSQSEGITEEDTESQASTPRPGGP